MKVIENHRLVVSAALVAAAGAIALQLTAASAMSATTYTDQLTKAGLKPATAPETAKHAGLKVEGKVITIEKDGKRATVEVLDYGSSERLREDWIVSNGSAPKPRAANVDLGGAYALWNEDSVLLVRTGAGNDADLALTARRVYLGEMGVGGSQPLPPNTGNAGLSANPDVHEQADQPAQGAEGAKLSSDDGRDLGSMVVPGAILAIALAGGGYATWSLVRGR